MKRGLALFLVLLILIPFIPVQAEKSTLRIVNANYLLARQQMATAVAQFKRIYPDVEIIQEDMNDTQLTADFLSRGGKVDVLCVNPLVSFLDLDDMVRAGCLENLSDHPALLAQKAAWINLDGVSLRGGEWVAVPVAMEAAIWRVNTQLANRLGITIPENWTWEDFFTLAQQVETLSGGSAYLMATGSGAINYPRSVLMANCVDMQSSTASFESEDSLRLLEIWQQCIAHQYIREQRQPLGELFMGAFPVENALLYANSATRIPRLGAADCVLPPTLGMLNRYPTPLCSLVVSRNANNKEAAIHFLEIYMSEAVQGSDSYLSTCPLLADRTKYRSDAAFSADWQAMTPSEENHRLWIQYLENSIECRSLGGSDDIQRYQAMCRGETTPAEYLAAIQQHAEMVLGE